MARITLVVDDSPNGLKAEHGLSILVETKAGAVLFDSGQTGSVLRNNLEALSIAMDGIIAVTLSHGHYDHIGGLRAAMSLAVNAKCYAHPSCFKPKYAQSNGELRYIGTPNNATISESLKRYNKTPVGILHGVVLSGEIPIKHPIYSTQTKFFTEEQGNLVPDNFTDEQCLIVRGNSGIAVLVGCAHRGIENNVLKAIEIAGKTEIKLLVGGFHLWNADEKRLEEVATFLASSPIETIACSHCTGEQATKYLQEKLGSRIVRAHVGMSWDI
jgi:7,8-dihydropterin-6-yl-methyl-4-(beta-D-ribofuranosyl)aminobenzene 5'-phosphate synthase